MTHWFPLGLDVLRHKNEVLERYCEEIGRDPATIERTMAAPVIVAGSEAEAQAFLERMPPERRPYVKVGPPEQMAEALRPYLDAGFTGFTFNNTFYRTPEQIGLVGELLRLVAGHGAGRRVLGAAANQVDQPAEDPLAVGPRPLCSNSSVSQVRRPRIVGGGLDGEVTLDVQVVDVDRGRHREPRSAAAGRRRRGRARDARRGARRPLAAAAARRSPPTSTGRRARP